MNSNRDEVPELSANSYGSISQDNNRSIPVTGARTRKYSESVGRSYVASAVARWIKIFSNIDISIFSRSMSIARPSGFAAAGIGVGSVVARGDDEPLIA